MNNSHKLSGIIASSGKAHGKAVIVTKNVIHRPPEVGEPYVVVADLTTPDLIPLLVDAAAIVTDIGGISSHIANIARELGIPCIVSTTYGSTRIKDGDFVEVNADINLVFWHPVGSQS